MFICAQLSGNVCTQWVEYNSLFSLSVDQGLKIGGGLLLLTITAWSFRFVANFILNR